MTRLAKTMVCPKPCHHSINTHHKTYATPEMPNQKKRHVFAPVITMPEPKDIPRACYKIISEQAITDCVLIHFCAKATLNELGTKVVNRQTAKDVSGLWLRSFLNGPSKYTELLAKIRSSILTEIEKHSSDKNYSLREMKDIIKQVSESIYPTMPF